jgi:hypothetical protein
MLSGWLLPFQFLFISSSCLIALPSNSKTMLNRNEESEHLCLAPYFKGNVLSFSPFNIMLTIGL